MNTDKKKMLDVNYKYTVILLCICLQKYEYGKKLIYLLKIFIFIFFQVY